MKIVEPMIAEDDLEAEIAAMESLAQYAGRLHRLHVAKREVIIYDYVDADEPMLARMEAKREAGYKTLGYAVSYAGDLFSGETYVTAGTRS